MGARLLKAALICLALGEPIAHAQDGELSRAIPVNSTEELVLLLDGPGRGGMWMNAEYLLWWTRPAPLGVPIATTGDPTLLRAGALGQSGTATLLGESNLPTNALSGMRLHGGIWLDPAATWAITAGGFFLERGSARQSVTSDANGNPPLFMPVSDATFGEDSFTIAFPAGVSGSIAVSASSTLWGADAAIARSWVLNERSQFRAFLGYRHLGLVERVDITAFGTDFGGILSDPNRPGFAQPGGSFFATLDSYRLANYFHGGQIGLQSEHALRDRLVVTIDARIAFGATCQVLDTHGATLVQQPGRPGLEFPVGLFAGAGSSGTFRQSVFSVVPEVALKFAYQWTDGLQLSAGYTVLGWSGVARPGDQINRNVDERAIPLANAFTPGFRPMTPAPPMRQSTFWAHGLNLGITFRF